MSFQEKQSIVSMVSGILIAVIYSWVIYQRHLDGVYDLTTDYRKWGVVFLVFMGISIGARIVIMIFFHILTVIATQDEKIPVEDERDKLIKLKSTRNGHIAFSLSFVVAFIFLATGMPVYGIFIFILAAGILTEMTDNLSQIYYHRKGV